MTCWLGFDGVRSPVRRHLFGDKYEPQLTGFSVWRVSLPRPAELERTVFAFAGPVKATLIPLSAGDCYLALVAPEVTHRSTGLPDRSSSRRCRACCRSSAAGSARCAT